MSIRSGRYLVAARSLTDMTQEQLATAAGIHPNSVKRWERSSERIGGYAVRQMVDALSKHGIDIRDGLIVIDD
jgi:DNA-binding transcriptional regulator YiaG